MSKHDPARYRWYTYQGKRLKINTEDAELSLTKGEIFGIARGSRTYVYLVDADRDHQIRLEPHDAERIVNNSKGYSGTVGRKTVRAGEGGLDKPRTEGEVRINSTLFKRGHYNKAKKTLALEFRNGNIWQYADVDAKEVLEFERTSSQGKWYNDYIKAAKEGQRMQSLSSNMPLYYRADQLGLEPDVYGEGLLPSGFALGQRAMLVFGNDVAEIPDCIVCGVHFYRGKVAYDLYVPNGFEDEQRTNDSPVERIQVYTLLTNIDSMNLQPNVVNNDE